MTVTVPAYAKINLFLDIVSVREDGYHNILSLMQGVDLCDTVTVTYSENTEKSIEVTCNDPRVPTDQSNLVCKAAAAFPVCGKIQIHIEKQIPMEAGLAGGSADAAATLIALNKLTGEKFTIAELQSIGARLGADIPFCIVGGAALVSGIGDVMIPVDKMPRYPIVIAKKGEGMSTPLAYKTLDQRYDSFTNYSPRKDLLSCLENGAQPLSDYCRGLFNLFETVVEPLRPCVSELKKLFLANGAAGAMMSGSGTSVFGIFENEENAKKALAAAISLGAEAHLCYPL